MSKYKLFSDLTITTAEELGLLVGNLTGRYKGPLLDLLMKFSPELKPNGMRGYYAASSVKVWDYLSTKYKHVLDARGIKEMSQLCMATLDWAMTYNLIQ